MKAKPGGKPDHTNVTMVTRKRRVKRAKGGPPANQEATDIVLATLRKEQCLALKLRGVTYEAMAKQVGISNAACHRYVHQALTESAERAQLSADQLRELEHKRLDHVQRNVSSVMDDAKAKTGERLAAAGTLVRTSESRRKLLGLDIQRDDLGVPIEQVISLVRAVASLAIETIADLGQRQKFVTGLRTLSGASVGQVIEAEPEKEEA